jgi:Fic family protein
MTGLLDLPALYLSNYIIEHKNEYYANLRKNHRKQIGKTGFCMLDMVEQTSLGKITNYSNRETDE